MHLCTYIALTVGCLELQLVEPRFFQGVPNYLSSKEFSGKVVSIEKETSLAVLRQDNRWGKCSKTRLKILTFIAY